MPPAVEAGDDRLVTPAEFIAKWNDATLRERQGSQMHFLDLCALLGEPQPTDPDAYCFERGASRAGSTDGWADVWRKGCFAWEYKGPHKDLDKAFRQLATYVSDLQNPPYLVTSDMARIVVRTNFTNTITKKIELTLEDLREPANLALLKQVFQGSDKLKPVISPQELTAKAVERFAELGQRLQNRRTPDDRPLHDPRAIAHFLNQLVFCMFAEDARLLPDGLFTRTLKGVQKRPERARQALSDLFAAMASESEDDRYLLGVGVIEWFNGGLFDGAEPLLLEPADLKLVADTAAEHDWSEIDPAIFGTMFEEALKATRKRAALGAHYTDRDKILKIVDPVIVRPLTAEWEAARAEIAAAADAARAAEARRQAVFDQAAEALKSGDAKADEAKRRKAVTAALKDRDAALAVARDRLEAFLVRLSDYRVLDPACGSGNFLYVALHALRDLELRALIEAERLTGLQSPAPRVGLQCVRGIEIEPYAAELARVTLWIGDLQWSLKNGFRNWPRPILSTLDQIENRDALLNPDGTEAEWITNDQAVDAIIGNPPFLGAADQKAELPQGVPQQLRAVYNERVSGRADLVVYWVQKAAELVLEGRLARFGFVTTKSIAKGKSRAPLELLADRGLIFDAWTNEAWALKGAAVRVSMISAGRAPAALAKPTLNGVEVERINPDLTAGLDITKARKLSTNLRVAFQGVKLTGPFDVQGDEARLLLRQPANPNGKSNRQVLSRLFDIDDIVGRDSDRWAVDFGTAMDEAAAALFEGPFHVVTERVVPFRKDPEMSRSDEARLVERYWEFQRPRGRLRAAIAGLERYIVTPESSEHRVFVHVPAGVIPQGSLFAIARQDDCTFGILSSRIHEVWSTAQGNRLGVGNQRRYNIGVTFETFPFPEGLTPNIPAADYADDPRAVAIAEAARELNQLRENWLNPPDLVRIEPEVVPGYPDRVLPRDEAAAKVLKTRTLTNLYNQRPAWLDMAHRRLDAAVAAAYGWPAELSDDAVLERLFALNQERAAARR